MDRLIGDAVRVLEAKGVLDNTVIIYTSDNGFHLGHHGMSYEKYTP